MHMCIRNTHGIGGRYYVVCKVSSRERIPKAVWVLAVLILCTGILAVYCFKQNTAFKEETMDNSRQANKPCVLGWYDVHDLWHFFAAITVTLVRFSNI